LLPPLIDNAPHRQSRLLPLLPIAAADLSPPMADADWRHSDRCCCCPSPPLQPSKVPYWLLHAAAANKINGGCEQRMTNNWCSLLPLPVATAACCSRCPLPPLPIAIAAHWRCCLLPLLPLSNAPEQLLRMAAQVKANSANKIQWKGKQQGEVADAEQQTSGAAEEKQQQWKQWEYSSTQDWRDVVEELLMVNRQKTISQNTCAKRAAAEHVNRSPSFHC
jgi:hypothetical protein